MNISYLQRALAVLLVTVVLTLQGYAQSHLSKILDKGEIRIGMSGEQAPYTMKNKEGKLIGFEVDIAKEMAKSMGVKLILVKMPFGELFGALEEGGIDAIMSGMTITAKRNMRALFAGPYKLSGKSMVTRSEDLANIQHLDDANDKNYKIAFLKGSTSEDFVRKNLTKVEAVPVDDYDTGLDMVMKYDVDALVADVRFCNVAEMEHGHEGLFKLDGLLSAEPIGAALLPEDHLLLNLFDNYLHTMELSGAIIDLEEKWFESDEWQSQVE